MLFSVNFLKPPPVLCYCWEGPDPPSGCFKVDQWLSSGVIASCHPAHSAPLTLPCASPGDFKLASAPSPPCRPQVGPGRWRGRPGRRARRGPAALRVGARPGPHASPVLTAALPQRRDHVCRARERPHGGPGGDPGVQLQQGQQAPGPHHAVPHRGGGRPVGGGDAEMV